MSTTDVRTDVECEEGHGPEWILIWGGGRADFLCTLCQTFFDWEVPDAR